MGQAAQKRGAGIAFPRHSIVSAAGGIGLFVREGKDPSPGMEAGDMNLQ